MMFGRNEDCGLALRLSWLEIRCDRRGDRYAGRAAATAGSRTRSGSPPIPAGNATACVWAYMGPDTADPPPLPNLEWNLVRGSNVHVSIRVQECNWLQALEGEIDSAHAPILHGRIDSKGPINDWIAKRDLRPTFECIRQDFGMSIAAKRRLDDQTALLARQPVHDAVLFAGAAAIEIPRSQRPCLGADRRRHTRSASCSPIIRPSPCRRTHPRVVRGRPSAAARAATRAGTPS